MAEAVGKDKDIETGLVAVRPGTGEILATYGGRDYLKHQYDNAFLADLPAGSSIHPFVLATALENGIGLRSTVDASPVKGVLNDDDDKPDATDLLQAMGHSYNTVFARLRARTGASAAGRVGLPTGSSPRVHAVDQAAAYAALADGRYAAPHIVARVGDSSGRTLLTVRPQVKRALPAAVAADVTFALRFGFKASVVMFGAKVSGTQPVTLDRPAAGKIGTTDANAAAWYCGYTPDVATAVVTYRASNRPLINRGNAPLREAGKIPAAIWQAVMATAVASRPFEDFPPPAWVGTTRRFATPTPSPTPTTPPPPAPSYLPTPHMDPSELRKKKQALRTRVPKTDQAHPSAPAKGGDQQSDPSGSSGGSMTR